MIWQLFALFLVLLFPANALSRNDVPYEPGGTRGCNSYGGEIPAPDIIGVPWTNDLQRYEKSRLKVVAYKKSRFYHKGYISDQNPRPCSSMASENQVVQITVSSGKSEVESAFVKLANGHIVPYDATVHGPPLMNRGRCLSTKGDFPVLDIGSEVIAPLYDKDACRLQAHGYRGTMKSPVRIQILPESKLLANTSKELPVRILFLNTSKAQVELLFAGHWIAHFHSVLPGFELEYDNIDRWASGGTKMRFSRVILPGESTELSALLKVSKDKAPGAYWLTFAFMNLWDEDVYIPSVPVQLTVGPS